MDSTCLGVLCEQFPEVFRFQGMQCSMLLSDMISMSTSLSCWGIHLLLSWACFSADLSALYSKSLCADGPTRVSISKISKSL